MLDDALGLISKPNKSRSSSSQMILALARRQDAVTARETYISAIGRTDLDWPEAVYEAYLTMETLHGTLETVAQAKANIRREQTKLAKRREKAAAEQYQYQYYQQAAEVAQASTGAEGQVEVVEVPLIPAVEGQATERVQTTEAAPAPAAPAQPVASSSTQQEEFKR
jgi:hypothetical protein